MAVRKGEPWGTEVDRPAGLVVAGSDAELADLVTRTPRPPLGVAAGDLARTVGAVRDAPRLQRLEVDLMQVEADGRPYVAVAHVVARRPGPLGWWRGPVVGVFTSEFLGTWDVAPRGHPADGRAEIVEVDAAMGVRARLQARRRLPTGTHVPHPLIRTRSAAAVEWRFERPMLVEIDGRRQGRIRSLRVTVEPDAYDLHV